MILHLLHGFNVHDKGKGSLDRLVPYLRKAGYRTRDLDYGWFGLLRVRFQNSIVAKKLCKRVNYGDIGVGHSNGCAILAEAANMGAPFSGLVFINPALDADHVVAPQVKWVQVYYNQGDVPVRVAKFLWHHPWGEMGRTGFTGQDDRVTNTDCGPVVDGHSDIFSRLGLGWGEIITQNIGDEVAFSSPPVE